MARPGLAARLAAYSVYGVIVFAIVSGLAGAWPFEGKAQESRLRHEIEIDLRALANGAWRLDYRLAAPAKRLDLGPSLNGFRARDWRVETQGLVLVSERGRDYLEPARKGARLAEAAIIVTAHANGFAKQYEPVKPLGPGAVLYTGHFWPYTEDGARYDAAFDITPADGGRVAAFGERADAFERWESPTNHPAFIYAGPLDPAEIGGAHALLDPAAPGWAKTEILSLAPRLIDFYARAFGAELALEPDIFLTMGADDEPGVFRYDGDALPGQIAMTLSGGGWRAQTDEGRMILAKGTAHEIAHLWLARARPAAGAVPDWIHEGAADALAAEALAALGVIAPAEVPARLDEARGECAGALDHGSLAAAEREGRWRASYACGHVLAVIAARIWDPYGSVAAFWKDFERRAGAKDGYDEKLFFEMIGEKTTDELAAELARFPHTAYAAPDKELEGLLQTVSHGLR